MKKIILFTLCMLLAGCTSVTNTTKQLTGLSALEQKNRIDADLAKTACVELCRSKITEEVDLSIGQCLSESVIPNWVCDVAHQPRTTQDNLPENQCAAFRNGTAQHFVEVDSNCNVLRFN